MPPAHELHSCRARAPQRLPSGIHRARPGKFTMLLLLADPDLPERAAHPLHHCARPAALHLSGRGFATMTAAAPTTCNTTSFSSRGSSRCAASWGSRWPRRRGAGVNPFLYLHHFLDTVRSLELVGLLFETSIATWESEHNSCFMFRGLKLPLRGLRHGL